MLGQIEKAVCEGIAAVIEPGDHALLVFGAQVALDEVRAAAVQILGVDLTEHIGVHQIIRVEDHHQVIAVLIISQGIQRLAESDRLARGGVRSVLPGFDDPGTGPAGNFGRTIRAVISDDIKIIELAGIIHGFQIMDDIPDHPFLVMRRNQHQETGRRIVVRVILCGFFETEKADDNLIEH